MNYKTTQLCGALLILITLAGLGSVVFLMKSHQLSLTGLLNKVAVKLALVEKSQPLISHQIRYQDTRVTQPVNRQYPRIFLSQLRHWDGLTTPLFYSKRVDIITKEKLGFGSHCNKDKLTTKLHCFLALPTRPDLRALEQLLINYKFSQPKVQGSYGNGWQFAFFYDIAKASPDFSTAATATINQNIADILASYLTLLDGDSASLWHGRASLASSAFLLATVLQADTPQAQLLYRRAYGHFNDLYQGIAATETWPEGYNYWINNRAFQVILALSAFKEQQSEPQRAVEILDTIKRIGLWHIYLTRPDFKIEGWADEGPRIDLKDESAKVIDLIAQITQDTVFFEYAQLIRSKHRAASYYSSYRWLLPFIYDASALGSWKVNSSMSLLGTDLATSELFGRDYSNHLSIRSDWSDNPTFVTYRAGHTFTHHQHYDAGHFSIYKGAPLAVNASRYSGQMNSDNRKYFGVRTVAKNSLLIQKKNELVKPNHLFTENVSDGGQRLVMPMGSAVVSFSDWQQSLYQRYHVEGAKLVSYDHQANLYTAITSDLTAAYNSNRFDDNNENGKVRRVERTLVYLMPQDMVLVYDRLNTIDPKYKTKWLLHTIKRPQIAKTQLLKGTALSGISSSRQPQINIQNGDSSMRLDILAPVNSETLVIGGDDYRYYVESDGDDAAFDGINFSGGAKEKKWYDLPQWRLEISPEEQTLDTQYLIAMQPRIDSENSKVRLPKTIVSTAVNATQFDDLLVLSDFHKTRWTLKTDRKILTLAVFVNKEAKLQIDKKDSYQYDKYELEPGFNYISLTEIIDGETTMELVAEL